MDVVCSVTNVSECVVITLINYELDTLQILLFYGTGYDFDMCLLRSHHAMT
jgi:hypothetical protein